MNERIKRIRKHYHLSQEEFGAKIGIKKSAVSLLESGKTRLTERNESSICREFNVNRDWLLNGIGPMFAPSPASDLEAIIKDKDLSPAELILIEKFLTLPDNERKVILGYVQKVAAELNKLEENKKESPYERDARLLREEADAVEQGAAKSSVSPSQERKEA